MTALADRHAHADGTAERLPEAQIQDYLPQVPGWEIVEGRLRREVQVANFRATLALVNQIGALAEEQNHHPDILIYRWNRVRLDLSTHTAGGLTENDFIMAAKFNRILE